MINLGQLRVIWMAMIGGTASYTLVIFALVSLGAISVDALPAAVMDGAGGLAILIMGGALFLRRALVARIPSSADREARITQYATATIVGMESGGLIVITLGLVSSSPTWILAGGGAAVGMMALARPTAEEAGIEG